MQKAAEERIENNLTFAFTTSSQWGDCQTDRQFCSGHHRCDGQSGGDQRNERGRHGSLEGLKELG